VLEELSRLLELSFGKKRENIVAEINKCGGMNTIKSLQNHFSVAQKIIQKYFTQTPQNPDEVAEERSE